MSQKASLHKTSDVLYNRHPYEPVSFAIDPNKVALSFGHRKLSKIKELLQNPNLTNNQKLETLNLLQPMLSNQETKIRAILEEGVMLFIEDYFKNLKICPE
jgi:hypothetical protein